MDPCFFLPSPIPQNNLFPRFGPSPFPNKMSRLFNSGSFYCLPPGVTEGASTLLDPPAAQPPPWASVRGLP